MPVHDPSHTLEGERGETWRLGLLFGALYFLQGIGEPTDGLMAQPVRSMLKGWGHSAGEIAAFSALLAIPWSLKPLFGLLTDFVPFCGTRRKGYLVLAGAATALALLGLTLFPVPRGARGTLLGWLLIPTAAVALSDVAVDALMIERGRPRGLTGLLQAVQWGCLYGAGIVTGLLGGVLCELGHESWSFAICGIGGLATLALVLARVREPVREGQGQAQGPGTGHQQGWRDRFAILTAAARPGPGSVLGVGGFLFLWNFNPFSNAILHVHMTRSLGFSERFYGGTVALTAASSIAASVAYGFYCRRVPMRMLVHASVVLGIASTLGYAAVDDERSAVLVTLAVGVTYMTATLIQLDLAAKACPPEVAGTLFALLMALENLGATTSTWLGGLLYDRGLERWDGRQAFHMLVLVGSAFTAGCWLLVPFLPRAAIAAPVTVDIEDRRA